MRSGTRVHPSPHHSLSLFLLIKVKHGTSQSMPSPPSSPSSHTYDSPSPLDHITNPSFPLVSSFFLFHSPSLSLFSSFSFLMQSSHVTFTFLRETIKYMAFSEAWVSQQNQRKRREEKRRRGEEEQGEEGVGSGRRGKEGE